MLKIVICFCLTFSGLFLFGQTIDSINSNLNASHLRISLLTCGVGEQVWETFGHTGIRVIDSDRHDEMRDVVFNYGTFDGYDKDFEIKFMKGKLLYYLSVYPYNDFLQEYKEGNKSVKEQVLLLDKKQNEYFLSLLAENAKPENKYYKYDFFFDNCATRIRNIFPKTFEGNFVFGQTIAPGSHPSFRDIINEYFYKKHWIRIGVNLLLGSKIDREMTSSEIMFLPDYLSIGIKDATVNKQKISTDTVTLLSGSPHDKAGINEPFIVFCCVFILTLLGLSFNNLRILGKIMSFLLLFITGIMGCVLLIMWFGTNHQTCANNFNLLWLLPTNLILAFFKPKGRNRYVLIAILFIVITFFLHLFNIQRITILEITPILLSLILVYGNIFRNSSILNAKQ